MRSKWQILEERMQKAYDEYRKLLDQMNGLKATNFGDGDQHCPCGAPIPTEAEFAKHYLVDDERYPNLGNCPTRYNNNRLMPALFDMWGGKPLEEVAYEEDKKRGQYSSETFEIPLTFEEWNRL